jgi:hypothetical protein
MAKALTAAGIARYKPGKERREIVTAPPPAFISFFRNPASDHSPCDFANPMASRRS